MTIKPPIEGRYSLCSNINSRGTIDDSMIRLIKNQKIPNAMTGLDFLRRIPMNIINAMMMRQIRVVGGDRNEYDKGTSWSRFILWGNGRRRRDM